MKAMAIVLAVVILSVAILLKDIGTEKTAKVIGAEGGCIDSDERDGNGIQPMLKGTTMLYSIRGRLIDKKVDRCVSSIVEEQYCNPTRTNILSQRIACAWGCDPDGARCSRGTRWV